MRIRSQYILTIVTNAIFLLSGCKGHTAGEEPPAPQTTGIIMPCIYADVSVPDTLVSRTYTPCTVRFTDFDCSICLDTEASLRLRGNSTSHYPKRPFLLKFPKKQKLYTMPEAKSWVLLANYLDKTLLRNALAFHMAQDSRLSWTPHSQFVEWYYNDVYKGVYQLCEKVQLNKNRVVVPDNGWMVEVDSWVAEEDIYFRTPHMEQPIRIDELANEENSSEQIEKIKTLFLKADSVLFSDNFCSVDSGWRLYLDEKSWGDWYLINEIAKNNDASLFSSCFMHSGFDGKIVMGPIWDFDIAFGNSIWNDCVSPEGFHIAKARWMERLLQDVQFKSAVRERFLFFYSRKEDYIYYILQSAAGLRPYALANDSVWHTIGVKLDANPVVYETYDEEIEALVQWLERRFEWMKETFTAE